MQRRGPVAPFGMQLQIATVPLHGGSREGGIRENSPTSARLRKWRRSWRRRSISARRPLSSIARSTVGELPVSRISRMIRVEPGPIPESRGKAPSGPTRSGRGASSPRITAAARLYPTFLAATTVRTPGRAGIPDHGVEICVGPELLQGHRSLPQWSGAFCVPVIRQWHRICLRICTLTCL